MSAIGSTLPSTTSTTGTSALNKDQLSMQQFMQLLVTQLQNQDPTSPMSDSEFFAQMAQLGTVQGMDQLNQSSQIQQAQSLMGKTVTASTTGANGSIITGTVARLSIVSGQYMLGIQDQTGNITDVSMSSIQAIKPAVDVSTTSQLIGKSVTGPATVSVNGVPQTVSLSGTVQGITNNQGSLSISVQTTQYGTVSMDPGKLTQVSG